MSQCKSHDAEIKIVEAAVNLEDDMLLAKIDGIDLVANKCCYHGSCRVAYITLATRAKDFKQKPEKEAVDLIEKYVLKNIIENGKPEQLESIYAKYLEYCNEYAIVHGPRADFRCRGVIRPESSTHVFLLPKTLNLKKKSVVAFASERPLSENIYTF